MEPTEIATNPSFISMLFGSGPVVQSVLILLICLSVGSWAIVIAKWLQMRRASNDSAEFSTIFWETKNFARIEDSSRRLEASPLAQLFIAGYRELSQMIQDGKERVSIDNDIEAIGRAIKRAELAEASKLESGITFLATVASAAPFIGLFGTVWGIMNSFHGLSFAKTATIQAVAPGISEALVATAVGLAAAIPAAVAYNYFAVALRNFKESMDSFSDEFLTIAKRNFLKVR